ncbi:PREDICTED: uncharacterized protein LOC104719764 isoform X2 [Camelina sativa]|uniref:Uncharacterized protein LOC104719764 isoform X2 n=1 Tax=Camelina sativa TaxID=90675 RepID=A0ABM0U5A8_CAMSA|nr:PREDICTED: uncharacterized protein LOC104719764 isoform X2 [Camelina sativa]
MKNMKMAWVPYIPLEKRDRQVDRVELSSLHLGVYSEKTIFIFTFSHLECLTRCIQSSFVYILCRSALKHLKDDRVKKFNYCLPCELIFFTTSMEMP